MTRGRARGGPVKPTSFDDVRHLALALPGVEERTSYGRPSFFVGKKMLACIGKQDDHIVMPMEFEERDIRMAAEPDVYFLTDHYRGWPCVLVRLATVRKETVSHLLERRWQEVAPKRLREKAASVGTTDKAKRPPRSS